MQVPASDERMRQDVRDAIHLALVEQHGLALARQHTAEVAITRLDTLASVSAFDTIFARQADRELRTLLERERTDAINRQAELKPMIQAFNQEDRRG